MTLKKVRQPAGARRRPGVRPGGQDRTLCYPELADAWSLAMTINDLPEGGAAHILSVSAAAPELAARLREIGFCEGDEVQLLTRGPLGAQPLAVRLSRRVIAMRTDEAQAIEVEP